MKALLYAIVFALSIGLTLAIQIWDRRRLREEQRAGAWNTASWGAALYAFGPLSMIGWLWVTRQDWPRWRRRGLAYALARSVVLLFLGVVAAIVVGVALELLARGFAWLLGVPVDG